jgi:hypothetical protein
MSDDTFLLYAWYELMSEGSFAATFFAYDIGCRALESGRWVQVHPLARYQFNTETGEVRLPEGDQ